VPEVFLTAKNRCGAVTGLIFGDAKQFLVFSSQMKAAAADVDAQGPYKGLLEGKGGHLRWV
jgi:hypothetical protein